MKRRLIICIGREHGSGGREVGEMLAARLNIPCYDKRIVQETAAGAHLSEEAVEKHDERSVSMANMGFPMGIRNPYIGEFDAGFYILNDKVFYEMSQTIQRLAREGSCVIIGRVAEEILKSDPDMVSVFVHASYQDRLNRVMERNDIDEKEAKRQIKRNDRNRANYHNFYASTKWGDASSYHLSISTSRFGIEGTVERLVRVFEDGESD